MSARPNPPLREEDRVLWNLIARSVTPLKGRTAMPEIPAADAAALDAREEASPQPPAPRRKAPPVAGAGTIDRTTHGKLAKGRLPLEARVDLHGLTQLQAHSLLLSFLHRAHAGGLRHVLVITGKGSSMGSEGVLRRAVPDWLRTPAFRGLVSAHQDAARRHGGEGALYVRLRRRETDRP
ncbi:MAG TPA: Smr/MutS family protein [Rhizobiaceae bacterium]|nr:Smr/MutS family protein [Rhizobiaceae bacterium]